MKKASLLYFLLACCLDGFCQSGKITGSVFDSLTKTPLDLATVSVFRQDSSLVTYQLSDKTGNFTIGKLPVNQKLLVRVSYTGYTGFDTSVHLEESKALALSVMLSLNFNDTNAVVVTATIPIRMNGDTLEINPAAFKMKQEAVIEELLNQVSGIVIWSDGSITVNGQKVQSLLVDGKPFLGSSDPRVATQNLPKTAVEKIQLYQEYDRSKIGQDQPAQPQDSLLTMNIKLKEGSKKGYFGKAGAGYGTMERFESDLSFQTYDKQTSMGVGGGFNNINKNIGNIQEMFQNNTFRNFNPNLYNVGRFGTSGINKNHSVGAVYAHSFIESANSRQNNRLTVNYNKAGTDSYVTDLGLENRTTLANPQFIRNEGTTTTRTSKHDLGINYVKTNSYNDDLNLNGTMSTNTDRSNSLRYSEVRDANGQLQSTNTTASESDRSGNSQSLSMRFAKSNSEEPAKAFTLQLDARRTNTESDRKVQSAFESFTDISKNTSYNRNYNTDNNYSSISGSLDYTGFKRMLLRRYNFFGINLSFVQRFNFSRSTDQVVVGDYDSTDKKYITNNNLSNRNTRELFEYTPTLSVSKNFSKYTGGSGYNVNLQIRLLEDIKTDKNSSSIPKRNLDRSFQFFRQEGSANFNYYKQQRYQFNTSLSYNKNYEYPALDLLYTIVDDINAYDIRIGNPNLENRLKQNINLYGKVITQNPKSLYSFNGNLNGGYSWSKNPVADSIINDFSGKRTSYYVNMDKSRSANLNYSFNLSRKINKSSIQLVYNGSFRTTRSPNYIDSRYNISKTGNLSNQITLQFFLRSILIINLETGLQRYKTEQTAAGLSSFKNTNRSMKLGVVLNYPTNFSISSTIERIGNSSLTKSTYLWNAFTTYRFMKQQAEVKFSAMDLLKQYQNITNSVNSFGTTTRITNGLQQYFLLTLSYYPRKFGKTQMKSQENR